MRLISRWYLPTTSYMWSALRMPSPMLPVLIRSCAQPVRRLSAIRKACTVNGKHVMYDFFRMHTGRVRQSGAKHFSGVGHVTDGPAI